MNMIVKERQSQIGDFKVGRLLPFREKRQVGPFTFIDHMRPQTLSYGRGMDVDQHPHIGLSTLTYLFEGVIEHCDSLGNKVIVKPGDVSFMTAGRGITHTERTPQSQRAKQYHRLHGYQFWIALPKELEEMKPQYQLLSGQNLPKSTGNGYDLTLIAGNGFGLKSPLSVFSNLFLVDLSSNNKTTLNLKDQLIGEIGIIVVHGLVEIETQPLKQGEMFITNSSPSTITLQENSQVLLCGGEQLPEERFMLWNFVSSKPKRLQKAKTDWINKEFPRVQNDHTYVAFPS